MITKIGDEWRKLRNHEGRGEKGDSLRNTMKKEIVEVNNYEIDPYHYRRDMTDPTEHGTSPLQCNKASFGPLSAPSKINN